MELPQDVITDFAKLTIDKKIEDTESNIYGVYRKILDKEYVKIDGSDILTPVESTVDADNGERVIVRIKDHHAIVTGNMTAPSARKKTVDDIKYDVDGNTDIIYAIIDDVELIFETIEEESEEILSRFNTVNTRIDDLHNKISLWENENYISGWATNSITLNTSQYSKLIFVMINSENNQYSTEIKEIDKNLMFKNTDDNIIFDILYDDKKRKITFDNNTINISDCSSSYDTTTYNNILIPYKIYGMK